MIGNSILEINDKLKSDTCRQVSCGEERFLQLIRVYNQYVAFMRDYTRDFNGGLNGYPLSMRGMMRSIIYSKKLLF